MYGITEFDKNPDAKGFLNAILQYANKLVQYSYKFFCDIILTRV